MRHTKYLGKDRILGVVCTWMLPEESAAPVKDSLDMKLCPKVSRLAFTDEDVQLHYNATLSHVSAWELHEI